MPEGTLTEVVINVGPSALGPLPAIGGGLYNAAGRYTAGGPSGPPPAPSAPTVPLQAPPTGSIYRWGELVRDPSFVPEVPVPDVPVPNAPAVAEATLSDLATLGQQIMADAPVAEVTVTGSALATAAAAANIIAGVLYPSQIAPEQSPIPASLPEVVVTNTKLPEMETKIDLQKLIRAAMPSLLRRFLDGLTDRLETSEGQLQTAVQQWTQKLSKELLNKLLGPNASTATRTAVQTAVQSAVDQLTEAVTSGKLDSATLAKNAADAATKLLTGTKTGTVPSRKTFLDPVISRLLGPKLSTLTGTTPQTQTQTQPLSNTRTRTKDCELPDRKQGKCRTGLFREQKDGSLKFVTWTEGKCQEPSKPYVSHRKRGPHK